MRSLIIVGFNHLFWKNALADAGYNSGENYDFLEQRKLISYIPKHGMFKGRPKEFVFAKSESYWLYPQEKR